MRQVRDEGGKRKISLKVRYRAGLMVRKREKRREVREVALYPQKIYDLFLRYHRPRLNDLANEHEC
jgi:hypothetical protein